MTSTVYLKIAKHSGSSASIDTIPLNVTNVSISVDKQIPTLTFTPQEVAQLIASGVDSTGLAEYQAINELVILIPSKVDENYVQVTERDIPLSFRARGNPNELDNTGVSNSLSFPTPTSGGLKGFIQQFGCELSAESVDISFNLEFVVAFILP